MPVVVRGDQESIGQGHFEINEPSQHRVWHPEREEEKLTLARRIQESAKEAAANFAAQMTFEFGGVAELVTEDTAELAA